MSMRAFWMAGLLACVAGCPAADEDGPALGASYPAAGELRIEGDRSFSVLAEGEVSLSVRYVDTSKQPVAGVAIDFALTGSPEGASLEAASAETDKDGVATVLLFAGRTAPEFQVRASIQGVEPQYFNITVTKPLDPTLTVELVYAGKRTITSNSLLVVEGMTCDQLAESTSTVRMSSSLLPDQTSMELSLGAGRSYAIAAAGSDETNSKLTWGCITYKAPVVERDETASKKSETITLTDIAFKAAAAIPLNISLDLKQAFGTLGPLARAAVTDVLPKTNTPEASFLLDALEAKVSIASARRNENLDSLLQSLLSATPAGPLALADALTAAATQDGATFLLQATLTPMAQGNASKLDLSPSAFAVPADSIAKQVSASALSQLGLAAFDASYDQATARVNVARLEISLGLGSYAAYLLEAVGQTPARYAASTGCNELAKLVTMRPSSFAGLSADNAASVCSAAVAALGPRIRERWAALDDTRNLLAFNGVGCAGMRDCNALSVHDRDGDKQIDDLGPAKFPGFWVGANSSAAGLMVDANLRLATQLAPSLR